MSDLPRKNSWAIAEHAGDPTPDRMQRLLDAWGGFRRESESCSHDPERLANEVHDGRDVVQCGLAYGHPSHQI